MARLVALDKEIHKNIRIDTQRAEAQGANLNMVPVMLNEFLKLAVQYPIALTKNKETGRFVCVAMFGFNPNENLFWKNNSWDSLYIPLHVARQPFFVGLANEAESSSEKQFVICVDSENDSVSTENGEAVFDADGNDTAFLTKTKETLAQLLDGEEQTSNFVNKLLELKLLQAMRLEITFANEESARIEGMYTINEDRIAELSKDQLFELQSLGYLKLIYVMVTSLGHIFSLINKKNESLTNLK